MNNHRVVTTEMLRQVHDQSRDELLVAASVLDALDPDGLHVLTASAQVDGLGKERVLCSAELALDGLDEPLLIDLLVVNADTFEQLPSAFDVLRAAGALVPGTAAQIDREFAALDGDEEGQEV